MVRWCGNKIIFFSVLWYCWLAPGKLKKSPAVKKLLPLFHEDSVSEASQGTCTEKSGEVWTCRSSDMVTNRQTHRYANHNTLLPYQMQSKQQTEVNLDSVLQNGIDLQVLLTVVRVKGAQRHKPQPRLLALPLHQGLAIPHESLARFPGVITSKIFLEGAHWERETPYHNNHSFNRLSPTEHPSPIADQFKHWLHSYPLWKVIVIHAETFS